MARTTLVPPLRVTADSACRRGYQMFRKRCALVESGAYLHQFGLAGAIPARATGARRSAPSSRSSAQAISANSPATIAPTTRYAAVARPAGTSCFCSRWRISTSRTNGRGEARRRGHRGRRDGPVAGHVDRHAHQRVAGVDAHAAPSSRRAPGTARSCDRRRGAPRSSRPDHAAAALPRGDVGEVGVLQARRPGSPGSWRRPRARRRIGASRQASRSRRVGPGGGDRQPPARSPPPAPRTPPAPPGWRRRPSRAVRLRARPPSAGRAPRRRSRPARRRRRPSAGPRRRPRPSSDPFHGSGIQTWLQPHSAARPTVPIRAPASAPVATGEREPARANAASTSSASTR